MTTESHEPDDTGDGDGAGAPQQLRDAYKRKTAENDELKAQLRKVTFDAAGLDPDKGMGKAVAAIYDGPLEKDAILAFAKDQFDYEPDTTDGETTPPPADTDQQQIDNAMGGSSHTGEKKTDAEQIADAEQARDWDRSMALKLGQVLGK